MYVFNRSRILAGWSAYFAHPLFRLKFTTLAFSVALGGGLAAVLTILSIVLVIVQWFNFGSGLAESLSFDGFQEISVEETVLSYDGILERARVTADVC